MPKVTSKLQLTVPKVIADKYGIRPGDELEWSAQPDGIRVRLRKGPKVEATVAERLALFDENTKWLDKLQSGKLAGKKGEAMHITRENRGWTREELYEDRGLPRRH